MFDQLFKLPKAVARHTNAPYAEERARYLAHCRQRGDSPRTVLSKAWDLLWVARRLSAFPNLDVTIQQIQALGNGPWQDRERACGRKLRGRRVRKLFVRVASDWLRYLGYLRTPAPRIPFQDQLDAYCDWAREERGLCQTTIVRAHDYVRDFLRWYDQFGRPLSEVQITDIDAYLADGAQRGWRRISIRNVAKSLRIFFRYSGERGWTPPALASAIQGPRIYALEDIPQGPPWADVQRLLATTLDSERAQDIRDRAVLMLFAIYGLRASEVAMLRLDHIDWEHNLLHVHRLKLRGAQTYPLLPSVGNAIIRYLQRVRRPSVHREVLDAD